MSDKKGIDVSYAQGYIDFEKLDKTQVQFAIVRSSFGWEAGQKDQMFDRNIKGFASKGIPCGAYHYSYAQSSEDAVKEAEYCIECIRGAKLSLPVFLDIEDPSVAACGRRVCTDIIREFCGYMKKHGYKTGVYLNPNWLENYVYKDEILGHYEIWLAQWDSDEPAYKCSMWQYKVGDSGCINGIYGQVDLDIMYSTTEKTQKFHVGEHVIVTDPINYDTGEKFTVYPDQKYTVIEAVGDRIVIGINGNVTAAVNAKYLKKAADNHADKKYIVYTVRPGDTLSGIAQKYNTTVSALVRENNIQNPDLIFSGQKIRIICN